MTSRRLVQPEETASRKSAFQGSRRQRALAWFIVTLLLVSTLGALVTLFAR